MVVVGGRTWFRAVSLNLKKKLTTWQIIQTIGHCSQHVFNAIFLDAAQYYNTFASKFNQRAGNISNEPQCPIFGILDRSLRGLSKCYCKNEIYIYILALVINCTVNKYYISLNLFPVFIVSLSAGYFTMF